MQLLRESWPATKVPLSAQMTTHFPSSNAAGIAVSVTYTINDDFAPSHRPATTVSS